MIKSAKKAIYAGLSEADVNHEELQTVFTGVQIFLNSRPLNTVSGDFNDETVLTPNHFLTAPDQKYRESHDRKERSSSILFYQKYPFGKLFSKIIFKSSSAFCFFLKFR